MTSEMTLKSANRPMLQIDRARAVYGARPFHIAAPTVWNSLPADVVSASSISVVKKEFEILLFKIASY